MVIPRLKYWIRKIIKEEENGLQPSLAEETAAAAKAAAAAAADVARVSHELLDSKIQGGRQFMNHLTLCFVPFFIHFLIPKEVIGIWNFQ